MSECANYECHNLSNTSAKDRVMDYQLTLEGDNFKKLLRDLQPSLRDDLAVPEITKLPKIKRFAVVAQDGDITDIICVVFYS